MNNQDQDTRFKRYDFTPKRSQVKHRHRPPVWPWILGFVIIVLILTFGVRYVLNSNSQVTNHTPTSHATTKKNNGNSHPQTSTKNATTANATNTKQQTTGTPTTTKPDQTNTSQPTSADNSNSSSSEFGEGHTFNSIQDARDWANASKSEWTAAGYNYWTVTQNSQGYYVLTFTK